MLPAYGEESGLSLIMIEQRIERHLATLLSRQKTKSAVLAMPSIRVIQAPVFHGYTISGWFEFEALVSISDVQKHLFSAEVDVRSVGHEAPTNVGIAGQSGLVIGDIRADSNNPRAIWLWAVADNLRLVADSVSRLIGEIAGRK
jgi:aspartate-semialdehyde dehydrogenase